MNPKIVLCLVILCILSSMAIAQAPSSGCCVNPGAVTLVCATERLVSSTECCPTKNLNPTYYNSTHGPSTQAECLGQQGPAFFFPDEFCEDRQECKLGCCCPAGEIKSQMQCTGSGNTFKEGRRDCAVACALPQCSDNLDNDLNGCKDNGADTGCTSPSDPTESGGQCQNVVGVGCENINYVPKVNNLLVRAVQGEKKLQLSWETECPSTLVANDVYRCAGKSCTNFELIGSTPHGSFTDEDALLKFETTYTYKIQSRFSVQTAKAVAQAQGSMGNLECWNKFDSVPFCIHESYYNQYKQYLIQNVAGFTQQSFQQNVKSTFGSKLNKAFTCTPSNVLSNELPPACSALEVCVVKGSEPACVAMSECNPEPDNIFGLFGTKIDCEEDNYCFFDRSISTIDACYQCSPIMSCYDYKSQESCEGEDQISGDNCQVHNCIWKSLSLELGTGVCVDTTTDNCVWCDKAGTDGIDSSASVSSVFEQCSLSKADLLSTEVDVCYFQGSEGVALNCKDVDCSDYDSVDCPLGIPEFDEFNVPKKVTDKCKIATCQTFGSLCHKNANKDTLIDCQNPECEADVFAPNTTMVPIIDRGVYKRLFIQIVDQANGQSVPTLRTTNNYKTYLCNEPCGGTGHPFDKFTSSYELIISNKKIFDSNNGSVLITLNENQNTIRYYSEDPSKNLGRVNTIQIIGSNTTTGPIIFRANVTQANVVDGRYYTRQRKPTIEIEFLEDAIITSAALLVDGSGVRLGMDYNVNKVKKNSLTVANNLNPGKYTLELNAKNEKGIFMEKVYSIEIFIDDVPPLVTAITPADKALLKTANVAFSITFDSEANFKSMKINAEDINTSKFSTTDKKTYTATFELPDGNKQISVSAEDYAGNAGSFTSTFVLNAKPLVISLRKPQFGVAPSYTFDLIVETDNDATCKFDLDDNLEFSLMNQFDSTGAILHTKTNFVGISDGDKKIHTLNVRCNDPVQGGEKLQTFDLSVDTEPPILKTAFAFPNPVVEDPRITTFKIETNKDAICKYSEKQTDFAKMEGTFIGFSNNTFSNVNKAEVQVDKDQSYLYHVACQARSGLISETKDIAFSADTKIPIQIKSNTLAYSNTSSITLAVETNKKAQCKYSPSDPKVTQGTVFGNPDYAHTRVLTLDAGKYTYYVVCKDPLAQAWSPALAITFTLDITPPIMISVDDTSPLTDNPEYEWRVDRLRAKWLGEDNETEVQNYLYTIEEFGTLNTIVNWTPSTIENEWVWLTKQNGTLSLVPGTKYFVRVMAKNIVGLFSDPLESDGVTIDPSLIPANCTNGARDSHETDVDCGGACNLCGEGKICAGDSDCLSGFCNAENICKGPTCADGVKNQDETDLDCGGSKCEKCPADKQCLADSDCQTNFCSFGYCKEAQACFDGILSGSETDVDCGGACPTKCASGAACNSDTDCNEGTKCISSVCKVCAEGDINCNGIPDSDENREKDTDGDGIPDAWELEMGLDPNDPSDADADFDKDGLSNLDEYKQRFSEFGESTDANNPDSDGDGVSDKVEVDKGFDPNDPSSKPKSIWSLIWLILLVVLLLSGLGAGSYYYFNKYAKPKKVPFRPMPIRPLTPMARRPMPIQKAESKKPDTLFKKREIEKRSGRSKLLDAFGSSSAAPAEEPKKTSPKEEPPKEEPEEPEEPEDTEEDAEEPDDEDEDSKEDKKARKKREHDDDVFKELKKINKEEFISKVKEPSRRQARKESLQKLQKMKRKK